MIFIIHNTDSTFNYYIMYMYMFCKIAEFRIDAVLQEMSCMRLVELPEDEPWTVKDFTNNTEELCAAGARELQTKSVNVEVHNI